MKNDLKIYDIKKELIKQKKELDLKQAILVEREETIKEICDHSIVFGITDSSQYKNTDAHIEMLFCPACSKTIKSINKEINDMIFCRSEIIHLTNIDLADRPDAFYAIENEAINNYDYYYDPNVKPEFKALSMSNAIKDKVKKKDF